MTYRDINFSVSKFPLGTTFVHNTAMQGGRSQTNFSWKFSFRDNQTNLLRVIWKVDMLKLYQTIGDSDIWSMGLIYHLKANIYRLQTGTITKWPKMVFILKLALPVGKMKQILLSRLSPTLRQISHSSLKMVRYCHTVCTCFVIY